MSCEPYSKLPRKSGRVDTKSELKRKISRKERRRIMREKREENNNKTIKHCDFWVSSKHRYCKFKPLKGSTKCSVHEDNAEGDKERIPCPIDPNHSIYKRNLDKHITVCSKTKDNNFIISQPLYDKGCNIPKGKRSDPTLENIKLVNEKNDDEDKIIKEWKTKLDNAVHKLLEELENNYNNCHCPAASNVLNGLIDNKVCDSKEGGALVEMVKDEIVSGDCVDKHDIQNKRLLSVMEDEGMFNNNNLLPLYIEYGCGRGGLSRWVMEYHKQQQQQQEEEEEEKGQEECITKGRYSCKPWTFLLVDREARRNKQENRKDINNNNNDESSSSSSSSLVMRLRMDIADLNLGKLLTPPMQNNNKHIYNITTTGDKSKSSVGYDERLQNLWDRYNNIRSQSGWPPSSICCIAKHLCGSATDLSLRTLLSISSSSTSSIKPSVLIATCCHHRCEYDMLCGKEILTSLIPDICDPNSFAILRTMAGWATSHEPLSKAKRANISPEKAYCGHLVKVLIDLCRVTWLKRTMKCDKVSYTPYVDCNISPENRCITAIGNIYNNSS